MSSNLRCERVRHGYSQKELSKRLGVCVKTVSNWEHGKGLPDVERLKRLCLLFNCSVDYLIGFSEEKCHGCVGEPNA